MIQLQNVSFAYGNGVPGVCDVNLHIQKGEMVLQVDQWTCAALL